MSMLQASAFFFARMWIGLFFRQKDLINKSHLFCDDQFIASVCFYANIGQCKFYCNLMCKVQICLSPFRYLILEWKFICVDEYNKYGI